MVISASNRAYVKTVLHVIQCLVLAVVQQAGKVSSVNKVGACMKLPALAGPRKMK